MTHGVARDQLRSFVDRIERAEETKREAADDVKDIYAEAKGFGFDTKILKKVIALRKKDEQERTEEELILDTYMAALGMIPQLDMFEADAPKAKSPAMALQSPRKAAEAVSDRTAINPVANVEEEATGAIAAASVDTASRAFEESERQRASMVGFTGDCRTEGKEQMDASAASVGDAAANALGIPEPIQPATEEGDSNEVAHDHSHAATAGTRINHIVPATAPKTARDFRPHCLKPDACGASGLDHCYSCRRAMQNQEEMA